ncbi:protein phosphatase Slingshot isoform X2 [Toxorhynchites rutilus septentrionalis]|uniref:protein phosphatase Slingshot isoform X2 n=1 Tax=Toxorhynchites rutilus septentrionalis TaxID=329112 RepID=UPI00247B0221|nr:protein phosphatase Slingshot isoform X2 [Toxorhynchites rutilus septentrionalis]
MSKDTSSADDEENAKLNRSLSECYFAGRGTVLMLGSNERLRATCEDQTQQQANNGTTTIAPNTSTVSSQQQPPRAASSSNTRTVRSRSDSADERESVGSSGSASSSASSSVSSAGSDIQQHLQSMFYLLRPEETLKMAVKLESLRAGRTRYLVVVSRPPARRRRQQPQHPLLSSSSLASASSSSCVSPAPPAAGVPISKQITSASLYKAASPSSSTSIIASCCGDETFVSSLDNCVLSASSKNITPLASASASAFVNTANNNKCVDKCDSNRPSSSSNVCSNSSVNSGKPTAGKSDGNTVKVCSTGLSGFINVTGSGTAGNVSRPLSSSAGSVGSGSSSSLGSSTKAPSCGSSGGGGGGSCAEIEESCLLGIDCNEKTTVGLVLRVLADTAIRLDGDGGFSVSSCGQQLIFKPVSVQAMWSALQTLHKVSSKAREHNFFAGGSSHEWVSYYEQNIDSDRSCLNEWHTMDALESRRPPSPDSIRNKPTEREETERVIRTTLKEIMMSVDLDVVTSKFIRGRLEEHLDMDLGEYKSFIDEEMLVILGQMDAPTEIFDHVYLGSEWNASNLEELQRNGVRHILNVTREIDNFFPGMFDYFNVRVYDDEKTDLLKHWDNTFKYISRVRMEGSKVLVHCKMGISRSASVVIAYAMKANNWDFDQALRHVKQKRNCIKPNKNFIMQLETYQGMLDAMKNREKLQRSKSETNLKSGSSSAKDGRLLPGSEPTPLIQALTRGNNANTMNKSGRFLRKIGERPKSWSPDSEKAVIVLETSRQQSHSLEHLMAPQNEAKTIRMPCGNGQNYSVSQNQIVHLQEGGMGVTEETSVPSDLFASSVRSIISELESNKAKETSSNHKRKGSSSSVASIAPEVDETKNDHQWDPGESKSPPPPAPTTTTASQSHDSTTTQPVVCWTSQSQVIQQALPIVVQPQQQQQQHVSRQSSWSSVDSAVVADMIRGTLSVSRHSSWGSGENQQQQQQQGQTALAPPSRNSSWSSYDTSNVGSSSIQTVVEVPGSASAKGTEEDLGQSGIFPYDKDEIPWHPGTVKRTKQKIEERSSSTSIKRICSEKFGQKHAKGKDCRGSVPGDCSQQRSNSEEVLPSTRTTTTIVSTTYARLSASAPDSYCLCPFGSKRVEDEQPTTQSHHRRFSFRKTVPDETKANDENTSISVSGIVKNLKMSFEAKVNDRSKKEQKKVRSLPSSPVAIHVEMNKHQSHGQNHGGKQHQQLQQQQQQQEDITVRDLVDRYEAPRLRASFNTHHRHNSSSSASNSEPVIVRQRPRSVFEPLKYAQNQQKPLISHSNSLLKSSDDFSRPPPIPPAVVSGGGPFVRGIVSFVGNTSSGNNSGSNGGSGPGGGGSVTKKIIQHHGKTHPLAKINLTKHRINATSTAAATAYNTM